MATQKKKKKKSSCLPRPETFLHYWTLLLTLLRELSLKKGEKKKRWQLLFVTLTQPNGGTRNVKTQSITFVATQRTYSSSTLIKV